MQDASRIRYEAGSEFAPDDPFGRISLELTRSGAATLAQARQGSRRSWTGRVEPSAFEAVLSHLEAGGFPAYRPGPIPPSADFTLSVATASGQSSSVTDSVHSENRSFRNALAWLDAVVRQLSRDAVPIGPVRNQRLVVDSRET